MPPPDTFPVALAISDLQLTTRAPGSRAEKDWLAVQRRYFRQLEDKQDRYHGIPILAAGDIFERWDAPPELINFCIQHMPRMYSIPGNHDLPHHRYADVHRSAYQTLVHAGVLLDVPPGPPTLYIPDASNTPVLALHGFPYGTTIGPRKHQPDTKIKRDVLHIALVHEYIWLRRDSNPALSETPSILTKEFAHRLYGFDTAIFGDNHCPFQWYKVAGGALPHLSNCGAFIRRHANERQYAPRVTVIHSDGTLTFEQFDTTKDQFHEAAESPATPVSDLRNLVDGFRQLKLGGVDFVSFLRQRANEPEMDPDVRDVLLELLEVVKK